MNLFYCVVWRSVGGGFTGKGELDTWVVRAVTRHSGNLHRSRTNYLP